MSNTKAHTGFSLLMAAVVVLCALALAVVLGTRFASAGNMSQPGSSTVPSSETYGFTTAETPVVTVAETDGNDTMTVTSEANVLANSTSRNISASVSSISAKKEAERIAAEEAARAEEQEKISQAQRNIATLQATCSNNAMGSLEDVDWTVGKDAFLNEWGTRIDAYLSGTALAGYGRVFAEAAWEYGVDPRWSPAISNTESGNGANCFMSHNAWGWGESSWSNWTDAIYSHVAGLANSYGYTLAYSFAATYCPPNTAHWYSNTLSQMQLI